MKRHGQRGQSGGSVAPDRAALIACDIVGHSSVKRHDVMLTRVRGINDVVARGMERIPSDLIWVSGGDGGYLMFMDDGWRCPLLEMVRDFRRWADEERVPLRMATHYGPIDVIEGAGGVPQPVGEVINTAAAILTRGTAAGIVASSQFRAAFGPVCGVEFHDERRLRLKHGRPQVLHLMSLADMAPRSRWTEAVEVDRQKLLEAVEEGRGFDAVYYAKRLLQVNGGDPVVASALARVNSLHFRYRTVSGEETVNDVLGHLKPADLRRLLGLGQLIERRYNELLCRRGDGGNTMFVILRGQVGVYSPEDGAATDPARPRATHSEGEIVGELAFALNRRRTADLVSLGDTALLSFDYEQVASLLNGKGDRYWGLMSGRALEHVSQRVPYLVGGPLGDLPEQERREWTEHLTTLQSNCDIIAREPHRPFTLADIRRRHRPTAGGGIYILASGHLQSQSTAGKELDGETFPLLYVDLPGLVVGPDHEYTADQGPARIIFVARAAINELPPAVHARVLRELKRAMHSLYHYDAFLAYNFADLAAVERWERGLREHGLRVFRDSPMPPAEPYADKDGRALLDALVMLVFVSPHAMVKDAGANLVMGEVRFRERHFTRCPRIAPVRLSGGNPQTLEIMYTEVGTERGEADAIAGIASYVRAIRGGEEEPPYGLCRQHGTRIS
jgi:Cyclic nucleotide-binding domain